VWGGGGGCRGYKGGGFSRLRHMEEGGVGANMRLLRVEDCYLNIMVAIILLLDISTFIYFINIIFYLCVVRDMCVVRARYIALSLRFC
jgi:hypothetical protein